jgi:hypothetical protein
LTQTKNVNGVVLLPTSAGVGDGVFCIDVADAAMPVRNIIASPEVNVASLGTSDEALVSARTIIPAVPQCPAPYTDATVATVIEEQGGTDSPHQFPIAFYVAFNS